MSADTPASFTPYSGVFQLADRRVDTAAGCISRDGEEIHVEPKAMQVLAYLAARPGEVVSRQDLESAIWSGTVVNYEAVTNAVIKLRKALGDDSHDSRIIETIPKRGYRLIGAITPVSEGSSPERKLAAVMYADVTGHSRLTGEDEEGTRRRLIGNLDTLNSAIKLHHGSVVHYPGDALLASFETVTDALTCAVEVQQELKSHNDNLPAEQRVEFRIGINLGEVIVDRDDIYGDGVNVAARLEDLADPGGICVSESVRNALHGKLLLGFESLGSQQVKNIVEPIRVYRITANPMAKPTARVLRHPLTALVAVIVGVAIGVSAWFIYDRPDVEPASVESMAFPLPDKPSIAVLPFDNLGGDPAQEILSDGLTNDIITDLSKFGHVFVIASNSTFTYKDKAVKVQQVAEDLGVRYVLEGSLQRAGEQLRINAQLIDAVTGHHLWAERYERSASDFFDIQEDILRTIVASMASEVTKAEFERAFSKPTDNLGAYDYYQRGLNAKGWTREANNEALQLIEKAIALDPNYARAYADLTWIHANNSSGRYRWGDDPERSMELVLKVAQKAVELAPDDYYSHWALGNAQMTHGNFDQASAAYERALSLNPNDSDLLANIEWLYKSGKAEQAITQMKLAMRINPHHPDWYFWDLGLAQYITGQYEDALATLNKMSKPPNGVRRTRAAVLVRLGRQEEAREVMSKFVETDLDMTLEEMEAFTWKDREALGRWIEDLRTAGLPEKRPMPLSD